MRVLLYSSVYWPSIGGIETVTDVLAQGLVKLGHECTVVTETELNGKTELVRPFSIVRRPALMKRWAMARENAIVHANGASVSMFPFAKLAGRPFVWTHNGYQVSCVDGLGWAYGMAAPMKPWESLMFHRHRIGWTHTAIQAIKLGIRRWVSSFVDLNLAGSHWVATRQPLPNQHVTYNPYPLHQFQAARNITEEKYEFAFVGRLVSEKGLPTLINAFHRLRTQTNFSAARLAIVGGGEMRDDLERMVNRLGLASQVDFLGPLHGTKLVEVMGHSRVGIIPSIWEEPYGGVTLEWLSAGRSVIISQSGGHAECAGAAGFRFPNGDEQALADCMAQALADPQTVERQRQIAASHVLNFDETKLINRFIEMYQLAIRNRSLPARSE